jgi:hypothetical protein
MVQHADPEVLALVALGEPADDATRAHLATCDACSAEVADLARVVVSARSLTPADTLVEPPDAVWLAVRSELELSPTLLPDGRSPEPSGRQASGTATGAAMTDAAVTDAAVTGAPTSASASTDDLSRARTSRATRRRTPWIAAAAAAGVLVGGVGGAWWARSADGERPAVVAEAALDPLPGWQATGQATVEQEPDGSRVLIVSLEGAGDQTGFHEVWLIDRGVKRLVSLGVLQGSSGRFTVPEGLDLAEFPVVDVSEEPLDGNPAHSGDSIIRGILGA